MNWTGGRLQRHSRNTPGSLTAKQRKHFAKSRVQQNIKPFSSLPLDPFSTLANEEAASPPIQADDNDFQSHGAVDPLIDFPARSHSPLLQKGSEHGIPCEQASGNRWNEMDGPSLIGIQSNKGTFYTNGKDNSSFTPRTIAVSAVENSFWERKQKLLQQEDWISAKRSRPVRMKFPQTSQTSQFGKRRKISPAEKLQSKSSSKKPLKARDYASSPGSIIVCIDDQIVHGKHPKRQDSVLPSHKPHELPSQYQALYENSKSISPSLPLEKEVLTLGHTPGFTDEYLDEYGVRKLYSPTASTGSYEGRSSSPILETPNCSPLASRESNRLSSSKCYSQKSRQPHSRETENQTSPSPSLHESVIGQKSTSLLSFTGRSNGSVISDISSVPTKIPYENEISLALNFVTNDKSLGNSSVEMLKSSDWDGVSTCANPEADLISSGNTGHRNGHDLSFSTSNNQDSDLVADFLNSEKENQSTSNREGPKGNAIRVANGSSRKPCHFLETGIQACPFTKVPPKICPTGHDQPCEKQISRSEDAVWMEFVLADPLDFP